MLERLSKLAARSAQLRKMAMDKQAVVGALASLAGRGAVGVGKWAVKHPGQALIGGLAAATAPGAVKGSYRQHMAGFNPDVQQAMHGMAPIPPGAS